MITAHAHRTWQAEHAQYVHGDQPCGICGDDTHDDDQHVWEDPCDINGCDGTVTGCNPDCGNHEEVRVSV